MRWSMRAMVGAGVQVATAIVPLAAAAQATPAASAHASSAVGAAAPATPVDSAAVAATWRLRGPHRTDAACDRVRSHMVSLGYATQPCYRISYPPGGTAPGPVAGWCFKIWQ
jgi:hypothetical protein